MEVSKDKYSLKGKKYQRRSKKQKNKNKCSFPSGTHQSSPFLNQQWIIINVKEPLNNNFNISKLISVKNKNNESFMSNKTGKLIFLKSNRKDTGLMNRNMKERISA